jgi:ubiquinol-cytochrome c reductase subunit 7
MDDIVSDEVDIVQEALKRISDKEAFERTFRIRQAMQLQLSNSFLPESEWVKFEEVFIYLA